MVLISREEERATVTVTTKPDSEEDDAEKQVPIATSDEVVTNSIASRSFSRSLSHISESSADGIVQTERSADSGEVASLASGLSITDIEMELPVRTPEALGSAPTDSVVTEENTPAVTEPHGSGAVLTPPCSPRTEGAEPHTPSHARPESGDVTYIARRVSVEEETSGAAADCLSSEGERPVDSGLEDALTAVVSSLDDYRGQFPELQLLEQELKLLQVTLKVRM